MRPPSLALALALLGAGCLTPSAIESAEVDVGGQLGDVVVPANAVLEPIAEGVRLVWADVALPMKETLTLPAGATMVKLTAKVGATESLSVVLRNAETLRRRCQTPSVSSWNEAILGEKSCVALTAIDPLPAEWEVLVSSVAKKADLVQVEILSTPLAGPAAALDLAQLSMPTFDLADTEVTKVKSFDGTMLHVETTRPATDEKVPTVIVSSPYNDATRKAKLRPSDDLIKDWGARGYAIVVADVRGYGDSGGCVEVWSANEQKDQKVLVEWVAQQDWSDGNVGFYGQSYVATTAVAAAVQAPEALKAIIAVAPVINAYDDWHFGGVPNGEDALSPVGYQQIGTATSSPQMTPEYLLNTANGVCDPTLAARANDPRAIYDAFYVERNFSARAKDVTAAVLYTQGFEDSNVKSAMINDWFNALETPKLGLFGHWVHQHPPRADQELLFLAWMDQYVKGKPLRLETLANAHSITNLGTIRETDAWPPADATDRRLFLDYAQRGLSDAPVDGYATLVLDPADLPVVPPTKTTVLRFEYEIAQSLHFAGAARLDLNARMEYGENGYVAAFLYDDDKLVTWGMFNIAHRNGHDKHVSAKAGDMLRFELPFLPTEHVFEPGHKLSLEVRGARLDDWAFVKPGQPVEIGLHGGEDGAALVLPTVPVESAAAAPVGLLWT